MNTEEILDIVKDFTNHIRFNEKAKYSVSQWYMAIEDLLELYIDKNTELQQEKEKNKKPEEVINNLAKGVRYLGTNEELTTEDIIKMFSPEEIKIDFDDFMKRWENEQHKKSNLKDKVIDRMAKQISCLSRNLDNVTNFERVSEEEYKVDFIKEYYFKKARGEEDGIN